MMMIDLREEGIGMEMEGLIVLLVVDVYIRSSSDIQNITKLLIYSFLVFFRGYFSAGKFWILITKV